MTYIPKVTLNENEMKQKSVHKTHLLCGEAPT